ncbi:winged helix-turn-helix domain-containing protein [Phyllobacterium leguminum]|uniref:Homeodomain-like domain-containing protein n=1 Tax=Phyllobacterium leguminum TaxID=314237 RepID=A0A318T3V0_9HYPH|nr:winged helix-turn-helix domain-containing protein [Phyllobacterium leguminum]PYE88771.1 Homeodomain-like domain-containing protein [Phyllobacterium leguminum]
MTTHAPPKLDIEKFRKVYALVSGGATDGERRAARARAEAVAKSAGMTFAQAVSKLDGVKPASKPASNPFDDLFNSPEARARKAERETRNDKLRAKVLSAYGSEAAVFAHNAREVLLAAAVEHIATWEYWTDDDDRQYRFASTLDGKKSHLWDMDSITPAIREAVTKAYPWPSNLDGVLREVKQWDRLRWDRGLFNGGGWDHHAEVECRISLLEHSLDEGQAATSWEDIQARFDWKRYEFERQWIDPTKREDPFMDRLEEDFRILREKSEGIHTVDTHGSDLSHTVRRTNADKRAAVLSMLDANPELSDREISRRVGVSPQTVGNWRNRHTP